MPECSANVLSFIYSINASEFHYFMCDSWLCLQTKAMAELVFRSWQRSGIAWVQVGTKTFVHRPTKGHLRMEARFHTCIGAPFLLAVLVITVADWTHI